MSLVHADFSFNQQRFNNVLFNASDAFNAILKNIIHIFHFIYLLLCVYGCRDLCVAVKGQF